MQMRGTVVLRLDVPVDAGDSLELRPVDDPERFMVVTAPEPCEAGGELRRRGQRGIQGNQRLQHGIENTGPGNLPVGNII